MLSRTSLVLRPLVRSHLATLSVPIRTAYSNQNKPETKKNTNQAINDAKAGKSAAEVKEQRKEEGGHSMTGETIEGASKEAKGNVTAANEGKPVNRPDAGPDVLREKGQKKQNSKPKSSK